MAVLSLAVVVGTPVLLYLVGCRLLPAVVGGLTEWHRKRRARQRPARPSVESAVVNLRRLRRELRAGQQPNHVRHVALQQAYDATLIQVCGYVEVDAPLAVAVGGDRPFARLVTESALEQAGVALDPRGPSLPRSDQGG